MKEVTLRNGSVEPEPLVVSMLFILRDLWQKEPIVAYELIAKCRDNDHQLFGNTGSRLEDLHLVDPGGEIHSSVRSIVVCSVKGDGMNMTMQNPLAPKAKR